MPCLESVNQFLVSVLVCVTKHLCAFHELLCGRHCSSAHNRSSNNVVSSGPSGRRYNCSGKPNACSSHCVSAKGVASLVAHTVKASAYKARDPGSIPGSGRCSGEGSGHQVLYSCLGNPMDGGAWWATVHGVAKRWTRLSRFTTTNAGTVAARGIFLVAFIRTLVIVMVTSVGVNAKLWSWLA